MTLSETQIDALFTLRELGAMNEHQAVMFIGKSRRTTLRSLIHLGLVRWFPTPEHWKLTPDGKAWLNDEDARRQLAEHQAKTDAAVKAWRETGV